MEISTLFAFLGAAIILTIMPGPDNLFVLAQSITQDKKAVLPHHLDYVRDFLFILVQRYSVSLRLFINRPLFSLL